MLLATNRQKKVLQFYKIEFSENITQGEIGQIIHALKNDYEKWKEWEKYCFYTDDYDKHSEHLKKFDVNKLKDITLPKDWNHEKAEQEYIEKEIAKQLDKEPDNSPFDKPQPIIEFTDRKFVLSGNFLYGTKKECENEITERGGIINKGVSSATDYLLIGSKGSPDYKHGSYGSKIVKAMDLRSNYGVPAIISEEHWKSQLK